MKLKNILLITYLTVLQALLPKEVIATKKIKC